MLPVTAQGSRYYVTLEAETAGDGSSWDNAMTLEAAIAAAQPNDEIWVKGYAEPDAYGKIYYVRNNLGYTLKSGVKLYGGFSGSETDADDRPVVDGKAYRMQYRTVISGDIGKKDAIDAANLIFPGNDTRRDNAAHVLTLEMTPTSENIGQWATEVDGITIAGGHAAGTGDDGHGGGILVKGSSYLEIVSNIETAVFDKTGTLTKGVFSVNKILGEDKAQILRFAALAESYSSHPIACALKAAYGKEADGTLVNGVTEHAGKGVEACVDGAKVLVGNAALMEMFNVEYEKANEAGTLVYVAKDGKYLGCVVISDELKNDAAAAISDLKHKQHVKNTVMLTGDSESAACYVAQKLGLDSFYAQLLPAQKVEITEKLIKEKSKNRSVVFVGDGINDAPVLTLADAGIAMGALGSDAAIEAADIVIMDDKPSKVCILIKIARKTMGIVKQNIVFAIGIKLLFLLLGAFGFVTMWGAVFADVGVTFIAILNSLRALHTSDFIKK